MAFAADAASADQLSAPSAEELFRRARALIPWLAERAEATAEARRVPEETISELKRNGFFKILQPRRWGGASNPAATSTWSARCCPMRTRAARSAGRTR